MSLPEFLRDFGVPVRSPLRSHWTPVGPWRWHSRVSRSATGVPIVLVHGFIISSLYMIPLAEHLAAMAPVHAIDFPGFGRSSGPQIVPSVDGLADALLEWQDVVGITRCHLVANSLGCQISAALATRHPKRVKTLTLIGPSIDSEAHSLGAQVSRLIAEIPTEPPRMWMNYTVDFLRAGPVRTATMLRAMFRDYIERRLPEVRCPTLLLRGEHDPIAPQDWLMRAARLLPRATTAVVPGASHCVQLSHPAPTAAAIEAFIRSAHGRRRT